VLKEHLSNHSALNPLENTSNHIAMY